LGGNQKDLNMIVENFKTLAKNPLREKALKIVEAGYEAIDIKKLIGQKIKLKNNKLHILDTMTSHSIDLSEYKNVFLIGIGKGSALACASLAKILGKRLRKGIAIDLNRAKNANSKLGIFTGTHPVPSIQNVNATKKIIALAEKAGENDLIISFICGGGSALLCGSEKELKSSKEIFGKLTKAGANIIEVNTIRKHLSEVKGGGLAKIAYPATMISLIVSDVLGNDLSMVASGPTIYNKTTKKDAERILKNYKLQTTNYELFETPKDKKYFKKVKNILFISNHEPIAAMAKKAKQFGFAPKIYSYKLDGEAKNSLLQLAKILPYGEVDKPMVVLAAGETTIKLGKNPGRGGRNMESVLGIISRSQIANRKSSGAKRLALSDKLVIISFASDGRDNTEAAGAIGDILTTNKAEKLKLNLKKYLNNHGTFEFFKKTGDLIFAEAKTFNVSDLMLILKQ